MTPHPALHLLRRPRRAYQAYRDRDGARYDIQGLRAVAVLAVVVDHLTGWPGGGFVGVDVFFVISGFLITGLMLNEHRRTGRISLVGFYRRRVKRLMPAALTTLAATIAVGHVVFFEDRWRSTVVDAGWAAGFAANWRFLRQQTDYFASAGPVSPFQHYWSLSVEEQFYAAWPLLLIVLLALSALGGRRATSRSTSEPGGEPGSEPGGEPASEGARRLTPLVLALGIAVPTVVSFLYALRQSDTAPVGAYFATTTRIWELGVGALLAIARPALQRIPTGARPVLAWAGLGAIAVAIATIDGTSGGFPAPAAGIPVLGAALVLAAGTRADGAQLRFVPLVTNPLARYIGDSSYSLYLWHFPVIVLADAWYGHGQGPYWAVTIAATIALTITSYHLIETPFRTSPFLERFETHHDRRAAVRTWVETWRRRYLDAAVVVVSAVVLALVVSQLSGPATTASAVAAPTPARAREDRGPARPTGAAAIGPANAAVVRELTAALAAPTWPTLDPPLGDVARDGTGAFAPCLTMQPETSGVCAGGNPSGPVIAVVGDSTAIGFLATMTAAFGSRYSIRGFTRLSCAFAVESRDPRAQAADCAGFLERSAAVLRELHPVLTVVMENYGDVLFDAASSDYQTQLSDWRRGTTGIMRLLGPTTDRLVFATSPPEGTSIQTCATRTSTPGDCVYEPGSYYGDVASQVSSIPGVHFLDLRSWFCAPSGDCPAFADGTPTKEDEAHATLAWSLKLGPAARERFGRFLPRASG